MSEDQKSSQVAIHEDFLQHVEDGSTRIRLLSGISVLVALLLTISYATQLALPLTGTASVTVNLTDPVVVVSEIVVFVLTIAWLYVGVSNYRFTTSLAKRIAITRAAEAEMEKRIT